MTPWLTIAIDSSIFFKRSEKKFSANITVGLSCDRCSNVVWKFRWWNWDVVMLKSGCLCIGLSGPSPESKPFYNQNDSNGLKNQGSKSSLGKRLTIVQKIIFPVNWNKEKMCKIYLYLTKISAYYCYLIFV